MLQVMLKDVKEEKDTATHEQDQDVADDMMDELEAMLKQPKKAVTRYLSEPQHLRWSLFVDCIRSCNILLV